MNTQLKLSKDEKRIIEYFWNKRQGNIQFGIPTLILAFLEAGEMVGDKSPVYLSVINNLTSLLQKGYVESLTNKDSDNWQLTTVGHLYLDRKHNKFKEFLHRTIESVPLIVVVTVGVIGFISSVFGIIEFFKH